MRVFVLALSILCSFFAVTEAFGKTRGVGGLGDTGYRVRSRGRQVYIVAPASGKFQQKLATAELRRLLYIRTGIFVQVVAYEQVSQIRKSDIALILGTKENPYIVQEAQKLGIGPETVVLELESFLLKSSSESTPQTLLIVGGDSAAVLMGVYRFAEKMGISFDLKGEVSDGVTAVFQLPEVDELSKPRFAVRGLQPFHDFPEGPDWWNKEDYRMLLAQFPKLGFNFLGLHSYVFEPTVWLTPDSSENVYESSYYSTLRDHGGFLPKPTSAFKYGSHYLFERDDFGSEVMMKAETPRDVFDRAGVLLKTAFDLARSLSVLTAVGAEVPVGRPTGVSLEGMYRGIFKKMMERYAPDFYWAWTPEEWSWFGNSAESLGTVSEELLMANDVSKSFGFQFATSGWVLGPVENRAYFDSLLPPEVPLSSINQNVGFDEPDVALSYIGRSRKHRWAISWLEDDPDLTSPQLWVRRLARDAQKSEEYGATGFMGIHWRTQTIEPSILALSSLTWLSGPIKGELLPRFKSVNQFYENWATAQFGSRVAAEVGEIFASLDSNLQRPSDWDIGPGGIFPDWPLNLHGCQAYGTGFGTEVNQRIGTGLALVPEPALDAACESGAGFAFHYAERKMILGGFAQGPGAIEFQNGRLLLVMRGIDNKIYLKERKDATTDLTDWYPLDGVEAVASPKLARVQGELWLYVATATGTVFRSKFLGTAHDWPWWRNWRSWENTGLPNSGFGSSGPSSVATPFGAFKIANTDQEFSFLTKLEQLKIQITEAPQRARYEFWLNRFRYLKALSNLRYTFALLNLELEGAQRKDEVIRLRREMVEILGRAYGFLIASIETTGDLGTLANLETHVQPLIFDAQDAKIRAVIGRELSADLKPGQAISGDPRLILLAAPTLTPLGEAYRVKVLVANADPANVSVQLRWRPLGAIAFAELQAINLGRGVFEMTIPTQEIKDAFEYSVEAQIVESVLHGPQTIAVTVLPEALKSSAP